MHTQPKAPPAQYNVALIGNPNVGKSSLFNRLTGMKQHTGNWPGKTVELARGSCAAENTLLNVVDLPGTYSLLYRSEEEAVTTRYLQQNRTDCVLVICDGTCLERNLILVLQLLALRQKLVICVNLLDEVRRRHITLDLKKLERLTGAPVVGICTADGTGLAELRRQIVRVCAQPQREDKTETALSDTPQQAAREYAARAAQIAAQVESRPSESTAGRVERTLDRLLLHRRTGIPLLLLLLLAILWLTVEGANYPSMLLENAFTAAGAFLRQVTAHWPAFLRGLLIDGMYFTLARVVAVMLPPMAIFFPLFTLLEDVGLLPRIAFLLDRPMCRCGAEGKMALTICMGIGCNAAGVTGCRIITSERERQIAIITNALTPCNGRFPALILFAGMILSGTGLNLSVFRAGLLLLFLLLSVTMTLLCARWLSRTVLKREQTSFLLEMPPYRKPRILQVIVRSVLDRTLFVLGRAVMIAAPAGMLIWLLANCRVAGGENVLTLLSTALDPIGLLLGMNGAILLAFVLGLPANELVLPITLLILCGGGTMAAQDAAQTAALLGRFGWDWKMALCAAVFFLFHWPCGTTIATIWKETKQPRTLALSILVPTAVGVGLCFVLQWILRLF